MSIIWVVIVIYLVPSRRWTEYMQGWRELDYLVNQILEGQADIKKIPERLYIEDSKVTSDLT